MSQRKETDFLLAAEEKEYYERQITTLKSFDEVDTLANSDSLDEEDIAEQTQHERAIQISNCANIVLLALKVTYLLTFLLCRESVSQLAERYSAKACCLEQVPFLFPY